MKVIRKSNHDHEDWRGQTVAESLAPVDAIYQQDADAIASALSASLPGGTFDRLIVELLKMKVSHFRVPWGDPWGDR